jgi:hypothetical protein
MSRPLFLPTLRQGAWLAAIGLAALSLGFALRHRLIEVTAIGTACAEGGATFLCAFRRGVHGLAQHSAFGIVALGAALLNLMRPHLVLWAVALAAAGTAIVLYNVALSALAVALLILSLARPAPETG